MLKVLIVDDEEGVRRSLKKVLSKDGYIIETAASGEEAIEIVNELKDLSIVISDYKMPGKDGLETLFEIGLINPEVTRIILTGYATLESAIEAVNYGIEGFLTKPFDNRELRLKVKEFYLKKRFKSFLPPRVYEKLLVGKLPLSPEEAEASVLFADIRGFSKMAKSMAPDELVSFLSNSYFSPLSRVVLKYGGTIDKYIGDCIMALFGLPVPLVDHEMKAFQAAFEMVNLKREIPFGVGIACGKVVGGIFGSPFKKEYTVFGDAVNRASKLQKVAKAGEIVVDGRIYRSIGKIFRCESLSSLENAYKVVLV